MILKGQGTAFMHVLKGQPPCFGQGASPENCLAGNHVPFHHGADDIPLLVIVQLCNSQLQVSRANYNIGRCSSPGRPDHL